MPHRPLLADVFQNHSNKCEDKISLVVVPSMRVVWKPADATIGSKSKEIVRKQSFYVYPIFSTSAVMEASKLYEGHLNLDHSYADRFCFFKKTSLRDRHC